jgi:hypothetical protein
VSIQKMEALDHAACTQQVASMEEPARGQSYAECRRLRVTYWQVGAVRAPEAQQASPIANQAPPGTNPGLTPAQARQGASWRLCALTPSAPSC